MNAYGERVEEEHPVPKLGFSETEKSRARVAFWITITLISLICLGILMEGAFAYDCGNPGSPTPKFWLRMNEATGGATTVIDDVCGDNNFVRNTTTENVTGIWDGQQDFEAGDSDQHYNYSTTALGLSNTSNRSLRMILTPESMTALQIAAAAGSTMSGTDRGRFMRVDIRSDDYVRCLCGYGSGTPPEISSTGILSNGEAYDVVCVYNGSRLALWINGTYNASVATASGCRGENDSFWIGTWDGNRLYPFDGKIDEVVYWETDLNEVQIRQLWLTNYINAPLITIGCYINQTTPTNASFSVTSTNVFTGNITCYSGDLADNCTLYFNGTSNSSNASLTNGSSFQITANTPNYRYDWHFNCSNGTYFNYTGNWTLYVMAPCSSSGSCDAALVAAHVWNYSSGRNLTYYNMTGIIACSNVSSTTETASAVWNYASGRNLTDFGTLVDDIVNAILASTLIDDIATAVWGYAGGRWAAVSNSYDVGHVIWEYDGGRNLTYFPTMNCSANCTNTTTARDVWNYADRNLTECPCCLDMFARQEGDIINGYLWPGTC